MMTFRDMSFCECSPGGFNLIVCGNTSCIRVLPAQAQAEAELIEVPIAWAEFKDSDYCPGYQPLELKSS